MKTTASKTVQALRLVDETGRWVSFTTEKGNGLRATMRNSLGEMAEMALEDAEQRIRHLLQGGWRRG